MKPEPVQTILVVDDFAVVRDITRLILERSGYSVVTATSGRTAVKKVEKHGAALALVLLEMNMPDMDGELTLHALRELQPDLPCIVFTSFCEDKALARMLQSGRCSFHPKPSSMVALVDKVQEMVDLHPRAAGS